MEPRLSDAPRGRRFFGLVSASRERRDAVRLREEEVLEPPVERLPAWSRLALAQGAYYAAFGAWPLVHLRSFETVTGPKPEEWLTKGVGACWLNVGIHLIAAGRRGGRVRRDVRALAIRMAATFAAFDFYYAGVRRRISPAYLINGFVQLGFVALWGLEKLAAERAQKRPPIAAHA
ncbi:MAG: hypothetical protein ACJ79H_16600 [Myxococcales bacterium]